MIRFYLVARSKDGLSEAKPITLERATMGFAPLNPSGLRYGPAGYARKYDPNQPRVPAGNPDGGQWTSGGSGENAGRPTTNPLESFAAARRRGRSMAYCLRQLAIDNLYCATREPASVRAACRSQAMERCPNCIVGRPIPPLPF
jgi:hypothetical protein